MKSQLVYVEKGTGAAHNGPAWIGRGFFSKTGKTIYFNGKAFHGGRGWVTEMITGDPYWISGVKKDGTDRHWADNQPSRKKIQIDADVVAEYLKLRGLTELPKSSFEVVSLNNVPPKEETTTLLNQEYENKASWLFQNQWYSEKRK